MSDINEIADPGRRAVQFLESLTLVGDFAGQPLRLRPWQRAIVEPLFGTLRKDGRRQYKRCFVALPRKQAKTTLAAGILGYMLFGEGIRKRSQRLYSASGDREQAALTFRTLAEMIRADEYLDAHAHIYDSYKEIEIPSLNNTYEALSRESRLKHGLSPSAVVFDEVHVLPDRDLHDVLTTGFGTRKEPLVIYITTAGWDRLSICWELWEYARGVRDGLVADATFLPIIYEIADGEGWDDERTWRRVMPALGDFCSIDEVREDLARAKQSPAFENTFKRLFLNQWTEQATRWLSMDRWADCGGPIDPAALAGRPCFGGLDLSLTRDLTAFVLCFGGAGDEPLEVLARFWVPEHGSWRDDHKSRELYQSWHTAGAIEFTPGGVIDYGLIEAEIVALAEAHDLKMIYADKAYANQIGQRLIGIHGLPFKFIPQTALHLNEPARELERRVIAGTLRHGDNPVLTWCAANVAARIGPTGLLSLDKPGSRGRIDGIVALVDAIAARGDDGAEGGGSVYETRGLLVL
jgi:phage terminase large subunit-like protein